MHHEQSQDTFAKPRGRRHRCPRCRATFETLRLSRLACPECGHAWEPRLGENLIGDAVTNLTEHALMAFGLLVTLGVLIIVVAGAVRWIGVASEGRDAVAVAIIVVLLLTGTTASICSPSMRVWSKLFRTHAARNSSDAQLDRLNGEDLARIHRIDPEFRQPR